ncbi:MAG TPA: Wzy polymerase domain-containing protein, partial [Burkholderiales bacterium]|nr:Wzy polymerase domain-containing protein [Burkholderiales bacterium]
MKTASGPATSLLLAGSMCLVPFLLPYHQQPLLSFFPEWLAAALGVAAALTLVLARDARAVPWPAPTGWLIVLAVFLAARAASGGHPYYQLPLLAALYVLYAVLMIRLGACLTAMLGVERTTMALAAFLVVGALLNSLAGAIQFYGHTKPFADVIAELHGSRAYGNISQPNLYANYLALGEGALLLLWVRARVRTSYAVPAMILLLLGGALSGSRGTVLYAIWYAVLGLLAVRIQDGAQAAQAQRLKIAACGVAASALVAYFAVPWLNDAFQLGRSEGALDRILASPGEFAASRLKASLIALRVFVGAPLIGIGTGEFAGAAFESGLDPSLTRGGEVWTSPHNLPLHLLAESGLVGTVLALGGLGVWGWRTARRYWTEGQVTCWWIIAAAGIEMIHSLTEFPLWSAHFLGVTALLVGVGAKLDMRSPAISRVGSLSPAAMCAALLVTLGLTLRDYVRLDMTRISGTTFTLTPAPQAHRDAEIMRELTHGLMAPLAELWIVIGVPLDRSDLADKLAMSGRVARCWPANAVVVRRAVFLALDGRAQEARGLLARALETFPHRLDATILTLGQARTADPDAI